MPSGARLALDGNLVHSCLVKKYSLILIVFGTIVSTYNTVFTRNISPKIHCELSTISIVNKSIKRNAGVDIFNFIF